MSIYGVQSNILEISMANSILAGGGEVDNYPLNSKICHIITFNDGTRIGEIVEQTSREIFLSNRINGTSTHT